MIYLLIIWFLSGFLCFITTTFLMMKVEEAPLCDVIHYEGFTVASILEIFFGPVVIGFIIIMYMREIHIKKRERIKNERELYYRKMKSGGFKLDKKDFEL